MQILALLFSLFMTFILPMALQILVVSLGVHFGIKRFKRWEEKQARKEYEKIMDKSRGRRK